MKRYRISQQLIPGGLTDILQSNDLVLNSSFKSKIRSYYEDWLIEKTMSSQEGKRPSKRPSLEFTKLPKMTRQDIYTWIVQAWMAVPQSVVQHALEAGFIGKF